MATSPHGQEQKEPQGTTGLQFLTRALLTLLLLPLAPHSPISTRLVDHSDQLLATAEHRRAGGRDPTSLKLVGNERLDGTQKKLAPPPSSIERKQWLLKTFGCGQFAFFSVSSGLEVCFFRSSKTQDYLSANAEQLYTKA